MAVDYQHPQFRKYIEDWQKCRDAAEGETAIKARRTKYLPGFIPEDKDRYDQYLKRASYTNFTGRTVEGFLGAIFRIDPQYRLPPEIEHMDENANGNGASLKQFSKQLVSEILQTGRAGILVDYPPAPAGLSAEQVKDMNLGSCLCLYNAESIINWSTTMMGGTSVLKMVVLQECEHVPIDEFESREETRYRVLSLDETGHYMQRVFNERGERVGEVVVPRGFDGGPLSAIPFVFVGAKENSPRPHKPPIIDLATVNIAHYRNSADYEEGVYIHGQGTMFVSSNMSADQWKTANPNGIQVGSRTGHFLGAQGSAMLLQMDANSAAREAMLGKESQMLAIGAKMVVTAAKAETAEAARIRASGEVSVLSTIADNIGEAIEDSLEFSCQFMGGDPEKVEFDLNREFFDSNLTPEEVAAMVMLADRGDIAQSDIRARLRKACWIGPDRTDETLDEEAEPNASLTGYASKPPICQVQ